MWLNLIRTLCLCLSLLCLPFVTQAAGGSFKIEDIKVEGLQRVDAGTVYNVLPVKVGDTFDPEESGAVIRALFKSGFYSDVELLQDGHTLIVKVVERPTIGRLDITGNKEIKTDALLDGLKQVNLAEGQTYVPAILEQVQQELESQYYSFGRYGVKINTSITELPRNRVAIDIEIEEGNPAQIREINFVGNHYFSDARLHRRFTLSTPGIMTWLTKNDQYSKQKLTGDLENLRSYYLDRGFVSFDIQSTQVSLSPNKQDIYLTINLHEGEAYRIRDVKFTGELILPEEELRKLVIFEKGELYSRKRVNATQKRITDRLGDEGYAFADVKPIPVLNEADKTVDINFTINPKKQVYVRHINFEGNYLSRDEVLRREMTQFEGGLASSKRIARSRNNLELLGYFKGVKIDTVPVPGTDDEVDLNVSVEEQMSGQLTGGIGYSQVDGITFNAGLSQNNFLGSGNMVDFLFNASPAFTSYRLGYNNPYYTDDGVSQGFDMFYQASNLEKSNITDYIRDAWGGTLNYGIPLSEVDRINAGIGYENLQIKTSSDPYDVSYQVSHFLNKYGDVYNTYRLLTSWSHNTLDRAVFPTSGLQQGFALNGTVPLSDIEYYKMSSNTRWYYPLSRDYVLLMRANAAFGNGYGRTSELPFFENYFAGGSGSVRGYKDNTLGPRDSLGKPIGGNFRLVGSTELIFQIPYIELESTRASVFIDGGNVYNTYQQSIDFGRLRYSAGVSVQWLSPLGPIVFSVAKPFHTFEGDEIEMFQFNIGSLY